MRRPGPSFAPAIVGILAGGAVLFVSEATWLRRGAALVLLVAAAIAVFAVATPEFVVADSDDRNRD